MSSWLLVLLALALVTAVPQALSVTLHSHAAYTMVNTTTGLIGLLAAFVFTERFRFTHRARDLVITATFVVLAVINLFLAARGSPVTAASAGSWHWFLVAVRLTGSAVLVAAVFLPDNSLEQSARLPGALRAGVVLLPVVGLDALLSSAAHTGRIYAGDILKLGAYLLILCGCLAEFRSLRLRLAQRVALDERRRMARDMHDGLAQELAFIASYSQRLGSGGDDAATVSHLRAAAERALHDSRATIAVLTSPDETPLDLLITRTADSFRSRFAVALDLDLDRRVVVGAEQRNALLRILHEALTNAIRHGSARNVLVRLAEHQHSAWLTIADDGSGFDVPAALSARKGLGLMSMKERAEMLGGGVRISSRPGAGTVVEVGLP
jgi:signal transduction histidine kinase